MRRKFGAKWRISQGGFIPPCGKSNRGAAKMLEFEVAAALRDQIIKLRGEGK